MYGPGTCVDTSSWEAPRPALVTPTRAPGSPGDGGPAVQAELSSPEGVAVDRSGDLVIADGGNGRVRIVRS